MLSAWAVAKLKPEDKDATTKAAELIVAALKHDNPNVRQGAAKALLELDAPRDVVGPPLLAAMDDPNPEVQDNVYRALASLGEAILPRMTERLKDPATQEKALRMLSRMGPAAAPAVPLVVELLGNADAHHRRELLFAVSQHRSRRRGGHAGPGSGLIGFGRGCAHGGRLRAGKHRSCRRRRGGGLAQETDCAGRRPEAGQRRGGVAAFNRKMPKRSRRRFLCSLAY